MNLLKSAKLEKTLLVGLERPCIHETLGSTTTSEIFLYQVCSIITSQQATKLESRYGIQYMYRFHKYFVATHVVERRQGQEIRWEHSRSWRSGKLWTTKFLFGSDCFCCTHLCSVLGPNSALKEYFRQCTPGWLHEGNCLTNCTVFHPLRTILIRLQFDF